MRDDTHSLVSDGCGASCRVLDKRSPDALADDLGVDEQVV